MADRTVILHYHLFKNAGTSVDRILKDNFPGRWETAEFPGRGRNNTELVTQWIQSKPDAVAFSSHTMLGPIPRIDGVRVISMLLLRDPVQRIRSAYQFERRQVADNFGAVLAKETGFDGYVRVRLSLPHDRQCRNFQTSRLAALVPGPEPEIDRAIKALQQISVLGFVEAFDAAMEALRRQLAPVYPGFRARRVRANVSDSAGAPELSGRPGIDKRLRHANGDDLRLLEAARNLDPPMQ
ncbi:MAG: sulfotransferase family 2 domain-containing protein [Rhodobacter sp.]|nr:sulfotransferase family 2 domain-containing protein [Rhodobacter sp.]